MPGRGRPRLPSHSVREATLAWIMNGIDAAWAPQGTPGASIPGARPLTVDDTLVVGRPETMRPSCARHNAHCAVRPASDGHRPPPGSTTLA